MVHGTKITENTMITIIYSCSIDFGLGTKQAFLKDSWYSFRPKNKVYIYSLKKNDFQRK